MNSFEKKIEKLEFHKELLLQMIDTKKYPFFEMVIKRGLVEEEVIEVYALCDSLTKEYEEQIELGFVFFQSLLQTFVTTLNNKLEPLETIESLYSQNLYSPLMTRLKELMQTKKRLR